ncbi:MAG: AMP-binding protein, partial [Reyranellaceae bacterium]
MAADTVLDLLARGADSAPAIGAPEHKPLTFAGLRDLAGKTMVDLNAMGIGRNDRVAIVLPNGPEMAAAFVAVASCATTAPLNPAYRADEFEFYLTDLKAKALLVQQGEDSPARAVAQKLGVPLVEVVPDRGKGAGFFTLRPEKPMAGTPALAGKAQPDDI